MYKGRRNPNTDSFGQVKRKELSNKQEAFVEPYLNCRNATEAGRCAGYSERSVRAIVRKLLTKANIQARIQERLAEMKMSADKVLMPLTIHACASIEHFIRISPDGFPSFDFSSLEAQENLYMIKKLKSKRTRRIEGRGDAAQEWENEIVEVELVNSRGVLILPGRFHGLFDNKRAKNLSLNIEGFDEIINKVCGTLKDGCEKTFNRRKGSICFLPRGKY